MRHKMLTQRTLFILCVMAKKYAESAFRDACRTSSASYPHRHGAMYCVSQLLAYPSYGHCLNLHCPDE